MLGLQNKERRSSFLRIIDAEVGFEARRGVPEEGKGNKERPGNPVPQ